MSSSVWLAIFMLLVLKIPLVYLALVVWWAIRDEPAVGEADGEAAPVPLSPCGWNDWRRRRGVPSRRPRPMRPLRPPTRSAYAEVT